MIVQFSGFGLLILSAISLSVSLIRGANHKLGELEEICRLLQYIKNNIEAFSMPIGDILRSFEHQNHSLEMFLTISENNGLRYAANHCKFSIGAKGEQILREFADKIGTGYKEDELRLCTYCLNAMNDLLNSEREEYGKRLKLYKTLPVMSALSVALLLL